MRTEVPLRRVITAFYPHTLTPERLQAREARDPVEPRLNRAPRAPSRGASGSALGPTPALLAPGAQESGGFPACLRQETRASLPPPPRTSRAHSWAELPQVEPTQNCLSASVWWCPFPYPLIPLYRRGRPHLHLLPTPGIMVHLLWASTFLPLQGER